MFLIFIVFLAWHFLHFFVYTAFRILQYEQIIQSNNTWYDNITSSKLLIYLYPFSVE